MAISNNDVGRSGTMHLYYYYHRPSLYQFFHVFDTKKEIIEEMISEDEKKVL